MRIYVLFDVPSIINFVPVSRAFNVTNGLTRRQESLDRLMLVTSIMVMVFNALTVGKPMLAWSTMLLLVLRASVVMAVVQATGVMVMVMIVVAVDAYMAVFLANDI